MCHRVTQATTFTYDSLNLLEATTNPRTETRAFAYDATRNLARVTDPSAQTVTFTYDPANQLTSKVLKDALGTVQDTVAYAYDGLGNLTLAQDSDSKLTFTYDGFGRLTLAGSGDAALPGLAQPVASVGYIYDNAGHPTRTNLFAALATPVSREVRATYDALGRVTNLFVPGTLLNRSLAYDALSRLTQISVGPLSTFTYDDASQLTSLVTTRQGNPLDSFVYTYDPAGNRQTLTDRLGLHSYTYDALNRLTAATHPVASGLPMESYAYDPVGNRTTSFLSTSHVHDAANRLLEDDSFTYTYDANGNLTSKTDKTTLAVTTYTYDVEHQLVGITAPGLTVSYAYDALGRRIQKTVNGQVTRYLYDQEDLWLILNGTTNLGTHLILHGPGIDQPLALVQDRGGDGNFLNAGGNPEPVLYLQTDGLGSIQTLVQESSGGPTLLPVERYTYDSFGQLTIRGRGTDGQLDTTDDPLLTQSAFGNPYTYTGREFDQESGLYYHRARYYDPRIGRFVQEDPIGLMGGINLYRYVNNNPNRYTDPFGLDQKEIVVVARDGVPHSVLEVDDPSSPTRKRYFDFFPSEPFSRISVITGNSVEGQVRESTTLDETSTVVVIKQEKQTSVTEDQQAIDEARQIMEAPSQYNLYRYNCFSFTEDLLN